MSKLPEIVLGATAVLSAGVPSVHAATDACVVPPAEGRIACGRPEPHPVDLEERRVEQVAGRDGAQAVPPNVAHISGVSQSGSMGVAEVTLVQPTASVGCGGAPSQTECSPREPKPLHVGESLAEAPESNYPSAAQGGGDTYPALTGISISVTP